MILILFKDAGGADFILLKLGQLIPIQERVKELGKEEWLGNPCQWGS